MKKYPSILQQDQSDCGSACVATICKYYKVDKSISEIRKIAKNTKDGTNIYGLVKALESFNFSAKAVKCSEKETIFKEFPKPAIAHIINDQGLFHFVVLYKIDKKNILIHDPEDGLKKLPIVEFLEKWTGYLIFTTPMYDIKEFAKEKKDGFFSLINILYAESKTLIVLVLATIVTMILGMISSLYLKMIVDDVLINESKIELHIISLGMLLIAVFLSTLNFLKDKVAIVLSERLNLRYSSALYQHLMNVPYNFFTQRETGEILNRFSDLETVLSTLVNTVFSIGLDGFLMIIGGIVLFIQSKELFILTLIPLFLYFCVMYGIKNILKKKTKTLLVLHDKVNSYVINSINNIETLKYNNLETESTEEFFEKNVKSTLSEIKLLNFSNKINFLTELIKITYSIGVIWVGVYLVLNNKITLGSLLSFMSLSVYFIGPVEKLINLQSTIHTGMVSFERIKDLLDLEEQKNNNLLKISEIKNSIALENVSFAYEYGKEIFENLTLNFNIGSIIGILGPNGSGKSTLAKLILNLYETDNGVIKIDDIHIKNIDVKSLREKILYISHKTSFFDGTILENLTFKKNTVNFKDVVNACKLVGMHEKIEELSSGYNTHISLKTLNFSQGELQKLNAVRALLSHADVLILDEITSNLDYTSKKIVMDLLSERYKNKILIFISHDNEILDYCTELYELKNRNFKVHTLERTM